MTPATIEAAVKAPTHPALRWTPALLNGPAEQHRRSKDGSGTDCGITAILTLAESTDPRCRGCFPIAPPLV